ncbi:MAG: hypothetical protein EZS28_034499 [Streblomastix strix]|uniref:Uncharacterized protein n=1 Tax=Streblomastix strix TaxID=222440 RepID=A0A5J4UGQ5_9EUKA|nr:MAG: hypothetical protein EZS28_034499 [Streblomastix strix]
MPLSFCAAGGIDEEQDNEIDYGLSVEQIEEKAANEEIEAQISYTKYNGHIKSWTNEAKAAQLNRFIHDY